MKKVLIACCLVFAANCCLTQDTAIYRRQVEIADQQFLSVMDSVIAHFDECVFVSEVPFCVSVSKEIWDNVECYVFITKPLNLSELRCYEEIFPQDTIYPLYYKSNLFLFLFTDSIITISPTVNVVKVNRNDWIQYLYMPEEDHPSKLFQIRSIDLYATKDFSFHRRIACENVEKMQRIINTPHTKLFMR